MVEYRPDIPAEIIRKVRQRCGFGCIFCGCPIYEIHHIIDWADTKSHDLEKHLSKGWTAWVAVPYNPDGHYVTAVAIKTSIEKGIKVKYVAADDPLNGFGKLYPLNSIYLEKSWAIIV